MVEWITTEDGLRIRPSPRLVQPITLDVFEQGMLRLGLDPDAVLGGNSALDDAPRPSLREAQGFLDLVLENAEAYDLRSMPADRAQAFLEVVTGHFIAAARGSW